MDLLPARPTTFTQVPVWVCVCVSCVVCVCVFTRVYARARCLTGGVIPPVIDVARSWLPGRWLPCEQTDWAFHVDVPTRSHEWKQVKDVLMLGIVADALVNAKDACVHHGDTRDARMLACLRCGKKSCILDTTRASTSRVCLNRFR